MATEEYSTGYAEGHQDGWNAAMESLPAQRTWVGLTDEEIINLMPDDDTPISIGEAFSKFADLIEAKLKEKNNV